MSEGQSFAPASVPSPEPRFSEARFHRLLEATTDAVLLTNRGGEIMLVNRQAEKLFGYERAELLRQPFEMLLAERCRKNPRDPGGGSDVLPPADLALALFGLRKDGHEFPLEIDASPLDPESPPPNEGPSTLANTLVIVRDLTDQRRAEAQRVKLAQVQEALRLRDEFLSVVSHELRTPLTPIQLQIDGALRATRRKDDDMLPTVLRKLEAIGNGIHRLSTLVNQLLDLSRISAGKLELDRAFLDLVGLARRSAVAFEDEAVRAESPIEFEAPRSEVRGKWDSSRLEQVIINLLSNALRYGGGKPVWLTVIEVRPGWATLLVRDQGVGIAPEHQRLVFQRFERLTQSRNRGGFGLGLWIVRQIVDAHNGTIKLFSRQGLGSTFGVDLPTGLQPPRPVRDDIVLFIHGDATARKNFREAALSVGCRGLTAAGISDAVALAQFGVVPRLVICDEALEASGKLAELREEKHLARAPIVSQPPRPLLPEDLRERIAVNCPGLLDSRLVPDPATV